MKKFARNVFACALALMIAVPLTSCKNSGSDKNSSGNARNGKKQTVIEESDPFFDAVEIPLDVETDKDKKLIYKEISDPVIVGDRIFATYNISYDIPKEVMESIEGIDCTNEKEFAKAQEIYNSYFEAGTLLFDTDGNLLSRTPSENMESSSGKLAKLNDGSYIMIASKIEPNECKTSTEIVKLNDKFEEQGSVKLDEDIELGFDPDVIALENGNFLLGDYSGITIVNKDGKTVARDSANGFCGKIYQADGKAYMLIDEFDSAKNEDKFYFQEIDTDTAKPKGDRIQTSFEAYDLIQGPEGLYSAGYSGLKKFDLTSGKSGDMLLDWNWTDINSGYISASNATILSEDEMIFTKYTWKEDDGKNKVSGRDVSIVKLSRLDKNPHAGKSVIELGCIGAEAEFRDYVIDYNKDPNHVSRIQISDYADQVFDKSDFTEALADISDRVYLDMISGDGPDILMNFYGFSQFNNEDILEDLNKYIDGQGGFNREEYFDNIFRAGEESGKLFQIPVCVNVSGFAGNPNLIGDRTSWTYEEFEQVASSLPENVSLIRDTARFDLLEMILDSSLSSFVDNVNKEVSFDSADFIKLLNIVKKYGSDKNVSDDKSLGREGMMEYVDDSDTFKEGLLALMNVDIYGVEDYARLFDGLSFKPTLIGMPGSENSGMATTAQLSFAISAASSHKDEAWDFIRFLFTEECQGRFAKSYWGIPVHRAALQKKNEEDVKAYNEYVEEFANYLKEEGLDENEYMNMTKIDPQICDGFIKMLEGVSVMKRTDTGIMSIIKEETAAFFENQKPAEDVCKVIQNRATTKVHER